MSEDEIMRQIRRNRRTDNPAWRIEATEGGQFTRMPPGPQRGATEPAPCPTCGTMHDATGNGGYP